MGLAYGSGCIKHWSMLLCKGRRNPNVPGDSHGKQIAHRISSSHSCHVAHPSATRLNSPLPWLWPPTLPACGYLLPALLLGRSSRMSMASPKSASFGMRSAVNNTFSGLISLEIHEGSDRESGSSKPSATRRVTTRACAHSMCAHEKRKAHGSALTRKSVRKTFGIHTYR